MEAKDSKREVVEPFSKKERRNVKAAGIFKHRDVGEIVVNKTAGTKTVVQFRNARVVEQSIADPMENVK